jgi:hypothetical protein
MFMRNSHGVSHKYTFWVKGRDTPHKRNVSDQHFPRIKSETLKKAKEAPGKRIKCGGVRAASERAFLKLIGCHLGKNCAYMQRIIAQCISICG